MNFLHKESTGTIQILTQVGEKSSYIAGTSVTGHLKPYGLEDQTFDATGIDGSLYKLTVKRIVSISGADQIIFDSKTYVVEVVKQYKGIGFDTTKILLSTK